MASIFNTEEKQPITTMDLLHMGFRYSKVDNWHIKEGHFYLVGSAPYINQPTWVVRFYPRGHYFEGKKLRSNRLVYKVFDVDRIRKEIDDAKDHGKYRSKKMPKTGYYTTKYVRNIGKMELDAVLNILKK